MSVIVDVTFQSKMEVHYFKRLYLSVPGLNFYCVKHIFGKMFDFTMTRYITAAILSIFSVLNTVASVPDKTIQLSLTRYSVQSGLVNNEVNRIIQGDKGFIWAATNNGLSRFDGYEFINFRSSYKSPDFFTSNTISDIMEDNEDRIWLVGPKGVNLFDKKTCTSFCIGDSLFSGSSLKCMLPVDDGLVMFGGKKGLYMYDADKGAAVKCPYPVKDGRNLTNVRELYMDRAGNIWIGTWERGIFLIVRGSSEIIKFDSSAIPKNVTVTRFLEDSEGNIFFSTWRNGLFCIKDVWSGHAEVFNYVGPETDAGHMEWNIIYDMDFDKDGNIWLGSPGGLHIVALEDDGFSEREYDCVTSDIQLHEITSVFCDKNGNMWLSDMGNGILSAHQVQSKVKEICFDDKGLQFSAVTSIWEAQDGALWLGVRGYGLVCYDPADDIIINSRFPELDKMDEESNAVVSFVEIPEKNRLFMSMRYHGIYMAQLDGGRPVSLKYYSVKCDGKRNDFTNVAVKDASGNIWVGTNGGVAVLRPDETGEDYYVYEPDDINHILGHCPVETILHTEDGTVWIGSRESGLFRIDIDNRSLKMTGYGIYSRGQGGINNDKILSLYEDLYGHLWVGTHGGGLSRYDREKDCFCMVDNMQLFLSDEICSITGDPRGNLWISTGNGFVYYSLDGNDNKIRNYGPGSGLRNLSFIKSSVYNNGNKVIFGGYGGLSIFDSFEILSQKGISVPLITDISVFNSSLGNLPDKDEKADFMPPFTTGIILGHNDKSFSITFASPCFENQSLAKYAYRLDGLEKDWNYVPAYQRSVTYSNLKPGHYTFYVMASNLGSEWTEPTQMSVTVHPAPWMTWWAISCYAAVLLATAVTLLYILRNRIRLHQALKIEQMERLKSEEVNNAKLMFFTNVSHELFTPITVMSCSLEKLLEKEDGDSDLYRIIRSNLNRLMRLLQQIMEFRKAESSNLRLKVSERDIVSFIKRICDENFAPLESTKNIRLVFSSAEDGIIGYIDPDKVDKIIYNLLSNAYKYNRKDGKVYVSIFMSEAEAGRYASFSVRDTGFGISRERQADLFRRFYEGDYRKFNTKGTGIGLSLTKDLVDLHKGVIKVESAEGEGTVFTVTIPIDRSAYSEDQLDMGIVNNHDTGSADLRAGTSFLETAGKIPDTGWSVLLVEDNDELLSVMKNILSSHYTIYTAMDGKEAFDVLQSAGIDLVITDYVMPNMDGVELCRRIRSDISMSHLPVIMLSARSAVESKVESFEAGADAYIAKPFEVKALVAQVDGLIANRKHLAETFRSGYSIETGSIIKTDIDRQFIEKAVRLVEEHISDPEFNIDAFNDAMNMSNSTLYRKIKGLTGMAPKEFIRNIRFKYACRLLLEKTTNITDVAFMVGFSDAKYFSLSFKKEFGITPSQYITQNRKKTHGNSGIQGL